MKKVLFLCLLAIASFSVKSQNLLGDSYPDSTWRLFTTPNFHFPIIATWDKRISIRYDTLRLDSFNIRKNDGVPSTSLGYLYLDDSGYVKRSILSSFPINDILGYTPYNGAINPNGYLTSQVKADWNSASGPSEILNKPTIPASPTFNNAVSRSLNSNYTISTTQNARVNYTVRVSYSITVLLGSTGVIQLQYSTNGGSSWNIVSTVSNNLNLGIALTGYNDFNLCGEIPANALVRINSTATNATNSYQTGQEILY